MYVYRLLTLILLLLVVVTTTVSGEAADSGEPSGTKDADEAKMVEEAKKKGKKSTKDWNKINFNDLEKQWEDGDEAEEMEFEFEHSEKIMKRKAKEAKAAQAKAKKAAASDKKKTGKPSSKPTKSKSGGSKSRKAAVGPEGDSDWVPPPPGFENIDMSQTIGPGGKGGPGGPGGGMPPGLEGFDMNNMDAGGPGQTEKDMGPQMWFVDLTMQQEQGPDKGKRWNRAALDKLAAYWGEMMRTAHLSAKMYVLGEYKNDPETKEETGPTLLVSLDKAWQQRDITKYVATQPEVLKLTKDRKTLTRFNFMDDDDEDEL